MAFSAVVVRKGRRSGLSTEELRHLEAVRASTRKAARESEGQALDELDARHAGPGVMAPPPGLERQRVGQARGEYRRRQSGEWDWFDGLAKAEQERLRRRWFAQRGHGESPDEIEERIPIGQWLDLTRQAGLSRALATGRGRHRHFVAVDAHGRVTHHVTRTDYGADEAF